MQNHNIIMLLHHVRIHQIIIFEIDTNLNKKKSAFVWDGKKIYMPERPQVSYLGDITVLVHYWCPNVLPYDLERYTTTFLHMVS